MLRGGGEEEGGGIFAPLAAVPELGGGDVPVSGRSDQVPIAAQEPVPRGHEGRLRPRPPPTLLQLARQNPPPQ